MVRKLGLALVFAAATLAARSAAADLNSGRIANASVTGKFYLTLISQAANETWTITTSNLSAGGDTVIHVQDHSDPNGGFIAGNDDYVFPASQVVVPPVGSARTLRVVVRSYSTSTQGTCDFTATSSIGGNISATAVPFGGSKFYIGDFSQSGHVTTVERQGGATDTVILTVGGPNYEAWHAVGYDDDHGVAAMSFVHDNEICLGCEIVVANYGTTGTTTADVVWDADVDSTDWDGDNLGASLENLICIGATCLNSSNADSDQDGLRDGDELLNKEVSFYPIKFATWGADPLQKDIFFEMDWAKCVNISDPNKCPTGDADSGQMGAGLPDAAFQAQIETIKTDFGPPANVRVHFDAGRSNSDPSTWTDWGNWFGASQLPAGDNCGETGNSPHRAYTFHHGISYAPEGAWGNSCLIPGPFFNTRVNIPRTITHETGHNLGLQHGGRPNKISINFKPHYVSLMNYNYSWDAGWSPGNAPVPSLNPTSLAERTGLGSAWPTTAVRTQVLTKLRDAWCPVTAYSTGKCVNIDGNAGAGIPIGSVDWNRDGFHAANVAVVQGPVNTWDFMWKGKSKFAPGTLKDPALSWVTVGGTFGDELFIFGRNGANQLVWTRRSRTAINAGCGSFTSFYDESSYNCAGFGFPGTANTVPGPKVLSFAPGAAEYGSAVNKQILVVFQKTTGTVTSSLVTIDNIADNVTFGSEVTLPGGFVATGDITVVAVSATEIRAYAPRGSGSSGRLREWKYLNGTWSDLGDQLWSDGSAVVPAFGIGATRGFQDDSATPRTYGAIPTWPDKLIEFARKDNASPFRWSKVTFTCPACLSNCPPQSFQCPSGTASSWAGTGGADLPPGGTQPRAAARPGLAYQKRSGQANYVGRFYMAINQATLCSGPFGNPSGNPNATPPDPLGCASRLIMTEGNLASGTPPSRRLTWITPAHQLADKFAIGGIALIDDLTRDSNLRLAITHPTGESNFYPLADGIYNANLSDIDDFAYVTGGLRAALCMDGGTWPNSCSLPANLP